MDKTTLTTVVRTQGNNQALKGGVVAPHGFDLDFQEIPVLVDAFRRMVRGQEFDVCEMAFTTYLCAKAHGKPLTALPVFLARGFHHGAIVRNRNSGIRRPEDLEGNRVGVNRGYTVTTGVWARGILQEQYGVDLGRITWVLSGDEHVAEYRPPANVVPMEQGKNLGSMLATGELVAAVGAEPDHEDVEPLIPEAKAAAFDALRVDGLYPINHLVVVRDELLESHPDLAADVFAAFAEAKNRYVHRLRHAEIAAPTPVDAMYQRVMTVFDDPLPYGIEPNRQMIDTLIAHAVHQRILDVPPRVDDLFAEATRDLIA